jgi:hypothetical protein
LHTWNTRAATQNKKKLQKVKIGKSAIDDIQKTSINTIYKQNSHNWNTRTAT